MNKTLAGIGIVAVAIVSAVVYFLPNKLPEVFLSKQESYPPFNEMIPLTLKDGNESDLYLVHPTVGTEVRLTHPGRNEELPIRSSKGRYILFRSREGSLWSVWLAENNGRETLVSESSREPVNAVFSRDETKVLLFEQEKGSASVSVIDLVSRKRERAAEHVRAASWLSTMRGVAYMWTKSDGQDVLSARQFSLEGNLEEPQDIATGAWWLLGERESSRFLVFAKFDDGVSLGEVSPQGNIDRAADFSLSGSPVFLSGELSENGRDIVFTYTTEREGSRTMEYSLETKELTEVSTRALDARFVGDLILFKDIQEGEGRVMIFDSKTKTKKPLTEKQGATY